MVAGLTGKSLEDIVSDGQLTLFVGAGISKPPPARAPVWRELQQGAIGALYERLKAANWPVEAGFFDDEQVVAGFAFRPEVFWNTVRFTAGMDYVYRSYQVLTGGLPNSNHRAIANLLRHGVLANVVTTNFDEYIDGLLDNSIRQLRSHREASTLIQHLTTGTTIQLGRTYLKLHGTLSDRDSLVFTLAATTQLHAALAACLRACLERRPLLIAGYSGNDEDIFPILKECVEQGDVTRLIVVVHPGSSQSDPIRRLSELQRVDLVEADIVPVLVEFSRQFSESVDRPSSRVDIDAAIQSGAIYTSAASTVPLIRVAHTIASLHEWVGNASGVVKYSHLAEDIFADERYRQESEPYGVSVFEDLARACAGTGDVFYQRSLKSKVASIEREASSRRPFNLQIEAECRAGLTVVDTLLVKESLDASEQAELETKVQQAVAFTNTPEYGETSLRAFVRWGLGKWRRRQGRLKEALTAFETVGKPSFDILGDRGPGQYLLDYGGTCIDYFHQLNLGQDNWVDGSLEYFQRGMKMLWTSAELAEKVSDPETAAKAYLVLARCYALYDDARSSEEVRKALARAQQHAIELGDGRLQARISDLKRTLLARSQP